MFLFQLSNLSHKVRVKKREAHSGGSRNASNLKMNVPFRLEHSHPKRQPTNTVYAPNLAGLLIVTNSRVLKKCESIFYVVRRKSWARRNRYLPTYTNEKIAPS